MRNRSEFLKSFGVAFEVFKSLTDEVLAQGGADEDVRRILTDRKVCREMVSALLKKVKSSANSVVRLLVDYTQPLSDLIKANGFDWVNSNITEKHFPITKRPNQEVETKMFHFNRPISSNEAIREMEKEGYRPAELPEGLAYARLNPDEQRKYPIVILGSVWQDWYGLRYVPFLWVDSGERGLGLGWCGREWDSYYRFLAVRKS